MIDERYLADAHRCPSCASLLAEPRTACSTCGLPLHGPLARRLWQVSVEASGLLAQRSRLVAELRALATAPAYAAPVGAAYPPVAQDVAPAPVATPAPAPRPEWTPRRVQNLLLGLGTGLLGVAAVIFVAVSWGQLGVGGRAAVMTGVTALAAYAALSARRRGLSATAEALSLLTVGLALLDCAGARASDLLGLRSVDGAAFAAGSAAVVALAAGAGSTVLRTRALRLSAAVLGQLPVPLLLMDATQRVDHPAALFAAGLSAQAVAALALAAGWPGRGVTRDARAAVAVGGILAGVLATESALGAAYVEDGSLVVGTALLLVAAIGVGLAAELTTRRPWTSSGAGAHVPSALRGVAAALVVGAAWAPPVDLVPGRWLAVALATAALVLLASTRAVPLDRRAAPVLVLLVATCGPGLAAVGPVLAAVAGRAQWPGQAWTVTGDPSARGLLVGLQLNDLRPAGAAIAPAAVLLVVVAAGLALAPMVLPAVRRAHAAAVPVAVAAGLLAAPALHTSYAVALGVDLALALAALTAGALLVRARRTGPGTAALASGTVVLAAAVTWSFAVDVATLVALPVAAAVLLVAVLAGRGVPVLRPPRVAAGVAAALLLVAEAGAVARYGGAGWPAVNSVVLSLLAVAGVVSSLVVARRAGADRLDSSLRRGLAMAGVAAGLADAGTLSWWSGAGAGGVGLSVVVAGAALLAASTLPVPARRVTVEDLRVVAGLAAVMGLLAAATDPDRLWTALLALGVGVTVMGVRVDHRWGWPAGVLLAGSSWVRLALSDVDAPEAYTVPPALALLAVGAWRRRRDPSYRSWHAYAAGLALGLGPSLLRAVTDAGELRPFLLGVAALVVLGVGVARRLQAPLVIGAGVLAVDATVQLAPYLAEAYDAVPRWVTIGLAGLVLLAAGATFERRMGDLRRVGRHVTGLG